MPAVGRGDPPADLVGSFLVILASALWGTSALFVKYLVAGASVSALALAFWRDLTAFVLLLAALRLLRPAWLRVERSDLRWLAAMGAGLGTFHIFWNLGVFLNGAAVATVQQAGMPAIVAFAAHFLWHEALEPKKLLAILLTFAGTVLVSGLDVLGRARLSWGGFLVGLAIPLLYATWNLLGKKVRGRYGPFTVLTYAFGFAALCLAPFQFFTKQPWPVDLLALGWFAGLIVLATIGGFSLYAYALVRLPASVATILAMSEIAFVAAYAFVLLGEQLSASQVAGALLVIGGVLLLSWPVRRRPLARGAPP